MRPRVLVTRPAAQADELARLLTARDMVPIMVPTVAIDTDATAAGLDAMLSDLAGADWLVLTSANGAEALAARLAASGRALPDGLRLAAVGPATAGALRAASIAVDHVPDVYLTAAIAEGLGRVAGRRVVLARADAATRTLREALEARGAVVEETVAYRTIEGPQANHDALRAAIHHGLEAIAFTSGSTVRGLMQLASPLDLARARTVPAFCIGPVTAAVARRLGFDVCAVADEHTSAGLADAIATHFAREDR